MIFYRNGFLILLSICLVGTVAFYLARDNTRDKLNERIISSLEINQEAVELFAVGQFSEARELLLESLSLNRLNPRTYVYLAFVELELDNAQGAYEYFMSGINMEVISAEIIKSLAEILIKNGYYGEAQKYLKYGLEDYPENEDLIFMLGKADLLNGNLNSSIKNFERLLEEKDGFLEVNKYLGLAYYYSGNKEKARDIYLEYLNNRGLLGENEKPAVDVLHEKVLQEWGEGNG